MDMDAATYDFVVRFAGSALAGILLFGVGRFIGWLMWRNTKRRAHDIEREDNTRAENLSTVVGESQEA